MRPRPITRCRPTRRDPLGALTVALAFGMLAATFGVLGAVPRSLEAQTPEPPRATLDAVAFLAGCWVGGSETVELREQWTAPAGGVMLGTTRFLRGDRLVDFEFGRIAVEEGHVVLWPYPGGRRSEHGFRLRDDENGAVFENPEHDFPVRILYRLRGPDRMTARIEGRDGAGREWDLRRVDCPR